MLDFKDAISELQVRESTIHKMYDSAFMAQTGDGTLEALRGAVQSIQKITDADDRIVIAFSDANLGGYNVTAEALKEVMTLSPNVSVYVIFVAEPRASQYLQAELPALQAYFVTDTTLIPSVMRELMRHTVQE